MSKTSLYHREIGFPGRMLEVVVGRRFACRFTHHALHACLNDRYGKIVPPAKFGPIAEGSVIEIEVLQHAKYQEIQKVVVRLPYNTQYDISIAFIPDLDTAIVKTCWLNDKTDTHTTLNAALYTKPV